MRVAAVIFGLIALSILSWMLQQVSESGFRTGMLLAGIVPLVLIMYAIQLWRGTPHARKAALATAIILAAGCAAHLGLIAWYAGLSVSIIDASPLQSTIVSLWAGIALYAAAACALVLSMRVRPDNSREHSRER